MQKVHEGLEDVKVVTSSICFIDGKKGILKYRGYDINDLAENATFEEAIYLLWHNNLPNKKELESFKKGLYRNMKLSKELKQLIISFSPSINPLLALCTCVSFIAANDKDTDNNSNEINKKRGLSIMAKMGTLVAAIERHAQGKISIEPKKDLSYAANFLYMLKGEMPSKHDEKIFDVCLILTAEHDLNASTFAARVAVSTWSDLYSAIVAAIATLKGPLHGGASIKSIENFENLANKIKGEKFCDEECIKIVDEYVMGMLCSTNA